MKKIISFFKRRSWLAVLLAFFLFVPQSFNYQARLNMRVIVTGLAIDRAEDGYEVTAQVVMPDPGSEAGGTSSRLDFISETGKSINEGIQKIEYKIGKMAALSHVGFIMVGESMLEENLVNSLDYFVRNPLISPATTLFIATGTGKDMIKQTQNLEMQVGAGLHKIFIYKQSSLNGTVTPVDEFVNSSFNLSGSGTISGIKISAEGKSSSNEAAQQGEQSGAGGLENLEDPEKSGSGGGSESLSEGSSGSSSGGSSGGDSSGGSSGSGSSSTGGESSMTNQSGRITYLNPIYYFKDGKFVGKLDEDKEILGFMLGDLYSNNGEFVVYDVNGDIMQGAVVGLQFSGKKTKKKIKFEGDKLVLNFDIAVRDVRVKEIQNSQSDPTINLYNKINQDMLKVIKTTLTEQVEQDILAAFNKAKEDDVDIFDIAELAYQTKTKEWKAFYEKYGENFLSKCQININLKIKNFS